MFPFTVRHMSRRRPSSQTRVMSMATDQTTASTYVDVKNVNSDDIFVQFHSEGGQKVQGRQESRFGCKIFLLATTIIGIFCCK